MNILLHLRRVLASVSTACVIMLTVTNALANDRGFRVAFPAVPGIDEIKAGHYDDAINILERGRHGPNEEQAAAALTTLCGAYVILRKYDAAQPVCDEAVAKHESSAAYNNRGVLRAYIGDSEGALQDFERIRVPPNEVQGYVEELKAGNPRLMASNNFEIIRRIEAAKRRHEKGDLLSLSGASVENMDEQ